MPKKPKRSEGSTLSPDVPPTPATPAGVPPIAFDVLQQVVLPIIAVARDGRWHPIGSAFVIAVDAPKRAFLLTAAHNLRAVLTIDRPHERRHLTMAPDFRPRAAEWADLAATRVFVGFNRDGHMTLAEMVRGWFAEPLDVALMVVEAPPEINASLEQRLALDSRPVLPGLPVFAAGYHTMTADFAEPPDYEAQRFKVQFKFEIRTTRPGHVTSLCPQGTGIHHSPGFLVDFPFDPGMSGGPVIDLSGTEPLVRGVVGSDLSDGSEQGARGSDSRAFASTLWPAMMTQLTETRLEFPDGAVLGPNARLIDLVARGFIDDRGQAHDHVRSLQTEEGQRLWWET